jgi:hypothetical protein
MNRALFLLSFRKIDFMFRLLFIPFLAILFFSCEADSKEIDPLFYQMSSEDSLKYSKELHDVLKL